MTCVTWRSFNCNSFMKTRGLGGGVRLSECHSSLDITDALVVVRL